MVRAFHHIRLTPLNILASSSILGLFIVAGLQVSGVFHSNAEATSYVATSTKPIASAAGASWQQEMILLGIATSSAPTSGTEDPVAMIAPQVLAQLIGEYQGLQASGTFTAQAGADAAAHIAPNVKAEVPYQPYTSGNMTTDQDTSYARMLIYRKDMQVALAPLLKNTRAEYEIYADYVATGDTSHLRELQDAAKNYSDAAEAAIHVVVPSDIAATHLDTVNALAHFAATLNSMAIHADDPIGSVALLRTYNSSELAVVDSFDRLAQYQRLKQP